MASTVTSPTSSEFSAGIPVEIGKIERELKRLWAESGTATRASLTNLAVYSEESGSLAKNTELISKITEDHACRAIVIEANPNAQQSQVQARISAHCHVTRAGKKAICSEQISFLIEGASTALMPNIVFSQLDSDLPLYLWWQGEFQDPMDPQLWAWVDRVIYDSQRWTDFDAQIRRIETAQQEARQRIVLCDLNWVRLVQLRIALAQFFDRPSTHCELQMIDSIEVDYAAGFRSTAVLLVGWFAAQLQLKAERADGETLTFSGDSGQRVAVRLKQTDGEPISRYVVRCAATQYAVTHAAGADVLAVTATIEGGAEMHQVMPAGKNDPLHLMAEELMRGGPHRVYLRALNCVRSLI